MKHDFNFIGRCTVKGCTCTLQITVPAKITNHTRNINYFPGCNNPAIWQAYQKSEPSYNPHYLFLFCAVHKREIAWKQVDGSLNHDHVCDARCTGAKGHSCDCSCGGANHGKAYAV